MVGPLRLGILGARTLRHTTYGKRYVSTLTNILADEIPPPVQVASITDNAIHLADGLIIPGACIFIEGKVFLWDVPTTLWDGWDTRHFKLFEVAGPRPEILLMGTGKTVSQPPPSIRTYMQSLGIRLDIMDTRNACATYNILSEEGRRVAAALLPLTPHKWRRTTMPDSTRKK